MRFPTIFKMTPFLPALLAFLVFISFLRSNTFAADRRPRVRNASTHNQSPRECLMLAIRDEVVAICTKNYTKFTIKDKSGRYCKIVFEYVELVRSIPEYEVKLVEVMKYNKTQPVMNMHFVVHDPKVMTYKLWIDGYEQYGIEHIYRRSALALVTSLCDVIVGSFFFSGDLQNFTNLPRKCPLKVGQLYHLRNFYFDEKTTPPTFPGYKWRSDTQIGPEGSKNTNGSLLLRLYVRIDWFERMRDTGKERLLPPNRAG